MTGTTLNDRYELLGIVGEGGMAVTYRARDTSLNREVAVKVLRTQFVGDAEFVERFRREAQAAAGLSHPNIAAVYDIGRQGNMPFIVMELVDGLDLAQVLKADGPLAIAQAVKLALQIAEALKQAHALGVVHRDIKPGNILLSNDQVKVTDFGIARTLSAERLTADQAILGTASYLSPEQARGEAAGPTSDLYALGAVMFELLTGRTPFHAETPVAVAVKQIQERPEAPSRWRPEVPFALDRVVLRCLAKEPADRYASAQMLIDDLQALDTISVAAPVPTATPFEFEPTQVIASGAVATAVAADESWRDHTGVMAKPVVPASGIDPARPLASRSQPASMASPKSNPILLGAVLVLLAGALGLGLAVFLTQNSLGGGMLEVPDLARMSLNDARQQLQQLGFRVGRIEHQADDSIPAGNVIGQAPAAGERIAREAEVALVVSKGKDEKLTTVPDVTQTLREKAVKQLEASGLRVASITEEASADVPAGIVISQNPEAGATISEGARVTLVISKGHEQPVVDQRPVAGVIEYTVPDEPAEQQIKIVVIDTAGERIIFDKLVPARERVREPVTGKGRTEIKVFNGDTIAETKTLEPQ